MHNNSNSNEKKPISPEELFSKLINSDFKESQCEDESTRLGQQREILMNLIGEYQIQIENHTYEMSEEEQLFVYKHELIRELQMLRNQRLNVETRMQHEMAMQQSNQGQTAEYQDWMGQLVSSRSRNHKLQIRIRDIADYIQKLEIQNRKLEEQRRIVQVNSINRRQVGQEHWRGKIDTMKRQQVTFEQDLRKKIRQKEEYALKSIQQQQLDIRERNRQKRESFMMGVKHGQNGMRQGQNVREWQSYNNSKSYEKYRYI